MIYLLSYSREEVKLSDIAIMTPNNYTIYYYEITGIKIGNLFEPHPFILFNTRDNIQLCIFYDTKELLKKLEEELNYFISSVLED